MPPAQPRSETPGHAADRPAPSRGELGHALFRLWLLNVLAGTLVGSLWFFDAPADRAPWIRIYVSLALVSSVAVLGMAPASTKAGSGCSASEATAPVARLEVGQTSIIAFFEASF